MKKMFLVGAAVASFALVGCNTQKDVNMSETGECDSCSTKACPESASPAVVGEKSSCSEAKRAQCEGQGTECPFSGNKN